MRVVLLLDAPIATSQFVLQFTVGEFEKLSVKEPHQLRHKVQSRVSMAKQLHASFTSQSTSPIGSWRGMPPLDS